MYSFSNNRAPTYLTCNDSNVKKYKEIPPFTKNNETGEILNDTAMPILVDDGFIDIYKSIQSYADECDLYSILGQVALSGDESLLNQKEGVYTDISNIPTNLNQFNSHINELSQSLNDNTRELIKPNANTDEVVRKEVERILKSMNIQRQQETNEKEIIKDEQ